MKKTMLLLVTITGIGFYSTMQARFGIGYIPRIKTGFKIKYKLLPYGNYAGMAIFVRDNPNDPDPKGNTDKLRHCAACNIFINDESIGTYTINGLTHNAPYLKCFDRKNEKLSIKGGETIIETKDFNKARKEALKASLNLAEEWLKIVNTTQQKKLKLKNKKPSKLSHIEMWSKRENDNEGLLTFNDYVNNYLKKEIQKGVDPTTKYGTTRYYCYSKEPTPKAPSGKRMKRRINHCNNCISE